MKMVNNVGRLWILYCIALLITTFFAASETGAWENGIDRPGSDIPGAAFWIDKNVEAFTAVQKCADACKKRSDCKSFTWVEPGRQGVNSHCWLKKSVPAPVKREWCISGVISSVSKKERCNNYASRAVSAAKSNIGWECCYTGPKWTTNYNKHYDWCMKAARSYADSEEAARKKLLSDCWNKKLTSLKGDMSCAWGSANCNRCVKNVAAELDRLQNRYNSSGRIRFDGYAYPTSGYILHRIGASWASGGAYEHVQSIGRIASLGNNEYMVFTHSTCSGQSGKNGALAVVRIGARQNTGGGPFYGIPNGDGPNQNTSNRTVARTYSGNNHPGGLSVLGRYVYVAQWCQDHCNYGWCNESSSTVHGMGFSVYDVSKVHLNSKINSSQPIHRYYRHVYGESWIGTSSICSIAAVKLSSGKYLVALGRSGGKKYG